MRDKETPHDQKSSNYSATHHDGHRNADSHQSGRTGHGERAPQRRALASNPVSEIRVGRDAPLITEQQVIFGTTRALRTPGKKTGQWIALLRPRRTRSTRSTMSAPGTAGTIRTTTPSSSRP